MIVDDPNEFWVFLFPTRPDKKGHYIAPIAFRGREHTTHEYLLHWGKWVIRDEHEGIMELASKLDPYVERRDIHVCKFTRTPFNPEERRTAVMCVYCDDRERDRIAAIVKKLGWDTSHWLYERDLVKKWLPGGEQHERMLERRRQEGKDPTKEADAIRRELLGAFGRDLATVDKELEKQQAPPAPKGPQLGE